MARISSHGYHNEENLTRKRKQGYQQRTNRKARTSYRGGNSFFKSHEFNNATVNNFPFIDNENMIVYTVPTTLAYRYAQMATGISGLVDGVKNNIRVVNQASITRVDRVFNILKNQEDRICNALEQDKQNKKDFITLLQEYWDEIFTVQTETAKVLSDFEKVKRQNDTKRKSNPNFDFALFEHKQLGIYKDRVRKLLADANIDPNWKGSYSEVKTIALSTIDKIIEQGSQKFAKQLETMLGEEVSKDGWLKSTGYSRALTKVLKDKAKITAEELADAILKVVKEKNKAKDLKDKAIGFYQSYQKDFRALVEQIKNIVRISNMKDSETVVKEIEQIARNKQSLATKLGRLLEPLLVASGTIVNSSYFSNPQLIPFSEQLDMTTDIVMKFQNDLKIGMSLKSTLDNEFSKTENITTNEIKENDIIFKEGGAFDILTNNSTESQILRFLTMSAASMFTIGVTVPDVVYQLIADLRGSFVSLGLLKAVMGSLLSMTTNKNINVDTRLTEIEQGLNSLPIIVTLFNKIHWTSDILRAGLEQLVKNYNYQKADHSNSHSMIQMLKISQLTGPAKQLDDLNFRYVFLTQKNLTTTTTPARQLRRGIDPIDPLSSLEALYQGSVAAKSLILQINELFKGTKLFDIYTSNINIYIDMKKYIK